MTQVAAHPIEKPVETKIQLDVSKMDLGRIEELAAPEFARLLAKAKTERPPIPIIDGKFVPAELDQMYRISDWIFSSGIYPKSLNPASAAKIMVCLSKGAAVGLDPMASLSAIMVVNNIPSIWGDAIPAILYGRKAVTAITETWEGLNPDGTAGDKTVASCTMTRTDSGESKTRTFSAAEAKAAGLWNKSGPWGDGYKKRMLQMRARAFCARDTCPDYLAGLSVAEEILDAAAATNAAALEQTRETVKTLVIPAPKGPEQATVSPEPQPGQDSSDGQTEPATEPDPDATRAAEGCSPGLPGCATEAADFSVGADGKRHCANHPEKLAAAPAPAEGSMFGTEPPAKPKRTKGPTPEQQQQIRKDRP